MAFTVADYTPGRSRVGCTEWEKGFHYGLWLKSIMFLKNNLKTLPKKKRLQIGAQIRATVQKRISK